ncbi:MAG: hypothetical protein J3Q66DRAFT_394258 [Benniella sp.]|nr:MAG: hypothetical protein J3Q66DRAFT_394258 [Benniella sp.]
MEHTDEDLTGISQSTPQPSSKAIAMALPEILYNVLTFLDRPSLTACLQVSCLWYTHAKTLAWQTISLDSFLFLDLMFNYRAESNRKHNITGDDKGKVDDNKLQEFIENCHRIRSLTLTRPKTYARLDTWIAFNSRATGLKNIVHLAVEALPPPNVSIWYCDWASALISQNPGIQELDWKLGSESESMYIEFLLMTKSIRKGLRKLSVEGYFTSEKMTFMDLLLNSDKKQQGRQPQKNSDQAGEKDEYDNIEEYFGLDELVLRDEDGFYADFSHRSRMKWKWLYRTRGKLAIHALTLINIDPDNKYNDEWVRNEEGDDDYHEEGDDDYYEEGDDDYYENDDDAYYEEDDDDNSGEDEPPGSILPLLDKCPRLEKLCVSFNLLHDEKSTSFLRAISEDPQFDMLRHGTVDEDDDFVEGMYESCPNLRDIEFGMLYMLADRHWCRMMELYGPQLESLSIWGKVTRFDSNAFMALMGHPISHPTTEQHRCLTRLNINGMEHLHDCAWKALYQLPLLKEFKARDVPLDARQLIREGGWVCGSVIDDDDSQFMDDKDEDSQRDTDGGSKRRLQDPETMERPKRVRKCPEGHQVQIKVCEVLGRLTRLRELRIDGGNDFEFSKHGWNCLDLTLETGLERLAPLRHSLEKLTVSGLDEGLSGRKEVEWMARNWIHYNNRRWLEQHHAPAPSGLRLTCLSQDTEEPERSGGTDDRIFSISSFRSLIGISGKGEDVLSTIQWLQEQCPTLSVTMAR